MKVKKVLRRTAKRVHLLLEGSIDYYSDDVTLDVGDEVQIGVDLPPEPHPLVPLASFPGRKPPKESF